MSKLKWKRTQADIRVRQNGSKSFAADNALVKPMTTTRDSPATTFGYVSSGVRKTLAKLRAQATKERAEAREQERIESLRFRIQALDAQNAASKNKSRAKSQTVKPKTRHVEIEARLAAMSDAEREANDRRIQEIASVKMKNVEELSGARYIPRANARFPKDHDQCSGSRCRK